MAYKNSADMKAWRDANKERIKQYSQLRNNTPEAKKQRAAYYLKNREKLRLKAKERYEDNKEECLKASRNRRLENKELFETYRKKWESKYPLYSTFHNAKRRSRERGVPFSLCYRDLEIPEFCEITGERMTRGNTESSASIDCIIPELGYVPNNVRFITKRINRIKAEGSAEEHEAIARYIRRNDPRHIE